MQNAKGQSQCKRSGQTESISRRQAGSIRQAANGQMRINSPGSQQENLHRGKRSEMSAVAKQDFAMRVWKVQAK